MKTEKPLSEQVAFKEKLAYGMGDAATAFSAVSVGSFSMYYFLPTTWECQLSCWDRCCSLRVFSMPSQIS